MIRILAIGKKHEPNLAATIDEYMRRLQPPWTMNWLLLPHSSLDYISARKEESTRLLARIKPGEFVVLLDETGRQFSSPELSQLIKQPLDQSRSVTLIIGGAYGVDERVLKRADIIWSLSKLVFAHQLVRLMLAEQIYRAQEIDRGGKYHHA